MKNRIATVLLITVIMTGTFSFSAYGSDNPGVKRLSIGLFGGPNVAKSGGRWMTLGGQFDRNAGYNPVFGGNISYAVSQPVSFEFTVYRGIFDRDEDPGRFTNEYWHFTGRGTVHLNDIFQTYRIGNRITPYISMGFGRMINEIEVVDGPDREFTVSTYLAALGFKFNLSSTVDLFTGYEYHLANTDHLDATPGRFTRDTWGMFLAGLSFNFGKSGAKHIAWHPRGASVDAQLERYGKELRELEKRYAGLNERDAGRDQQLAGLHDRLDEHSEKFDIVFDRLDDHDGRLRNLEGMLTIPLDVDILFSIDLAVLSEQAMAVLDRLVIRLREEPHIHVRVTGHTDNTGPTAHNLRLSERRAESVANYMIRRRIAPERISTIGMGEHEPAAPNETIEGRRLNRRVEIELLVMGE